MNKILAVLIGFVVAVAAGVALILELRTDDAVKPRPKVKTVSGVARFASAEEFRTYLLAAADASAGTELLLGTSAVRNVATSPVIEDIGSQVGLGAPESATDLGKKSLTYSTTNVQVEGIDEPDIVKTNGRQLYIAQENPYVIYDDVLPLMEVDRSSTTILPVTPTSKTHVVTAFPLDALAKTGAIDQAGELLLIDSTLVVFQPTKILGYDVSNPAQPTSTWTLAYEGQERLITARLYKNKLYLVTSTSASIDDPCPLKPFSIGSDTVTVPCDRIYHPVDPVASDTTYTASILDPVKGEAEQTVSFVGSAGSSVVYMSEAALYVTYLSYADPVALLYDFYSSAAADLLPKDYLERLKKLQGYDLSAAAKITELQSLFERQMRDLSDDEQLTLTTNLENRMKNYQAKHQREYASTGIVKIGLKDLSVDANGSVPGQLLNQFSLDEDRKTLRVATTSGDAWFSGFGGRSQTSVNDVYVLDEKLRTVGSVTDLGKGERIYSVRFLGNRGYVVTFRQTDPFYVIDFTDAQKPVLAGELKIPGFSSYLDPLTDTLVVGVGQEDGKVKLSLFDVTDPENPTEASHFSLDEYWSDVQSNHHAFLQDAKHQVFFLPAGSNGYVMSYKNQTLSLSAAVKGQQVQRAVTIEDHLYLVASDKVVVLQESDWQTVKELAL